MEFRSYYQSLTDEQKKSFAQQAGYELSYIETHLIRAYKTPGRKGMRRLVKASNGAVSWQEILLHFYGAEILAPQPEQTA